MPFTCSYVAGKANLRSRWPLYVGGYLAYVSACSWVEYQIQERPERMWIFIGFAVAVKACVEWYRRTQAAEFRLMFNEGPEPAVRTLGLQE